MVIGSNHRLIQPQTVGKKEGAPIIFGGEKVSSHIHEESRGGTTHEYAVQCLRIVSGGQLTGILHVALQVPELLQSDFGDINDIVGLIDGRFWIRSPWNS